MILPAVVCDSEDAMINSLCTCRMMQVPPMNRSPHWAEAEFENVDCLDRFLGFFGK